MSIESTSFCLICDQSATASLECLDVDNDNLDTIEQAGSALGREVAVTERTSTCLFHEFLTRLDEIRQGIKDSQPRSLSLLVLLQRLLDLNSTVTTQAKLDAQVAALEGANASLKHNIASLRAKNLFLRNQQRKQSAECEQHWNTLRLQGGALDRLGKRFLRLLQRLQKPAWLVQISEHRIVAISEVQRDRDSHAQIEEQHHTAVMAQLCTVCEAIHDLSRELGRSDGRWGAGVGGSSSPSSGGGALFLRTNHPLLYLSAVTFLYLIMGSYFGPPYEPIGSATYCGHAAWSSFGFIEGHVGTARCVGEWPT